MLQNKHIVRLSFVGLFIYIITNILLYKYFMIEEVILKHASAQNVHIVEAYRARSWDNNPNAVKKIQKQSYKHLLQDKDFIQFAKMSNDFLRNTDVYITIYDRFGNKMITNQEISIISMNKHNSDSYYDKFLLSLDKYFLQDYIYEQPISEAFNGKTAHSLIPHAIIQDEDDNKQYSFVNSYVPIINSDMGEFRIEGVVKITRDITKQWNDIVYFEKRLFISFVIVFLVFFIIIMYNTSYAQRIINKQFETNRELGEAKNRAELESSSKTKFLANISHELRTPLSSIIGFSEIILEETYGKIANIQYQDYINDINISGKHLLSVINDILDLSKALADKLSVDTMELDLNKVAAASMRFVKPRADAELLQLVQNFPKERVIINANPQRLKQVLLNLLSNAVKFTPQKGNVTLSITKDSVKKLVYICVSDTGIGMEEKDIPKALSPFGQIDNSLSRKYEGTGLGLPLTQKLIKLMGGTFLLESVKNKGTNVTITFDYTESIQI